MTCSCGGKILTVYIRQGKPLRWVPVGRVCIQCWRGVWTAVTIPAGQDSLEVTLPVHDSGAVVTSDTHQADTNETPPLKDQFSLRAGAAMARGTERQLACTCGPGERAKGKHNKKCPARE